LHSPQRRSIEQRTAIKPGRSGLGCSGDGQHPVGEAIAERRHQQHQRRGDQRCRAGHANSVGIDAQRGPEHTELHASSGERQHQTQARGHRRGTAALQHTAGVGRPARAGSEIHLK